MRHQPIAIYAHRGAQNGAPENSFSALELAIAAGARHIEFDVQLTQDEELVIIHDEHLYRTAGRAGQICQMTNEELKSVDVGSYFSPSFKKERIPAFEPWMARIKASGLTPNIELKMNSGPLIGVKEYGQKLAKKVATYLHENWPKSRELRVSSFDFQALETIREVGFDGDVAFLADWYQPEHLPLMHALKASAYHVNYKHIKPKEIARVVFSGYPVLAYTINRLDEAKRFVRLGGSGFFTNNVLLMDHF